MDPFTRTRYNRELDHRTRMLWKMEGTDAKPPEDRARRVHQSSLAGAWYPADKAALIGEIDSCLKSATPPSLDGICALILPHAGYRWSGATAAWGTRLLPRDCWDRVVVMGPSHRMAMNNVASLPDATHFANPMGELPLDIEFIEHLKAHAAFAGPPRAHQGEHSVEIQLPLLQHAIGTFRVVPIVVGQLDTATVQEMGAILRPLLDDRTLVVASSDFTHYGQRFGYTPFSDDVPEKLKALDSGALDRIVAKDASGFLEYVRRTGATICGRCPIAILLSMLPSDAESRILHYDTSGGISGDYANSVSYAAVAFRGSWQAETPRAVSGKTAIPTAAEGSELSLEDGRQLLRLAREALAFGVRTGRPPMAAEVTVPITRAFEAHAGAFVTLRQSRQLRGCIGEIYPTRSLYQAVIHQAVNAGLHDRRFAPVDGSELDELTIEVSVLTPPRSVGSADEIVVGRDGIILRKGARTSVFLPKVAVEQGWNLEETLGHLARKAGLGDDAWREGAAFQVFQATVFSDKGFE